MAASPKLESPIHGCVHSCAIDDIALAALREQQREEIRCSLCEDVIEGAPPPTAPGESPAVWYRLVSASYLDAMGIALKRGRNFIPHEAEPVLIINEELARRHWAGQDPIGRRMRFSDDGPWFTIVGIAGDVKQEGARLAPRAQTFIPYWHLPEAGINVVLKTAAQPETLAMPLRQAVRAVDPDIPVTNIAAMTTLVSDSIEEPRFLAVLVGLFAGLALVLAAIGIYGVLSYAVSQRSSEIGLRLALGAGRRDVFSLIVADGFRLAAIGVAIGIAVSLFVAPTLSTLLFNIKPIDPMTFALVVAVILGVGACASIIPARRATRVDPLTALRAE